jgi:hypothetical protein
MEISVLAHRGNWQPQRNRTFRELLSARVEHMLLTGAPQIAERLRNSSSRHRSTATEYASLLTIALPRGLLVSTALYLARIVALCVKS